MSRDDPEDLRFGRHLALARDGDDGAIEQILAMTELRLRRYVDARLGPQLRASLRNSDVLQNSYMAMLDALPGFGGTTRDEFVAWLTRIIEHDIRRQHRWFGAQKRRHPRTSERNALAHILLDSPRTPSAELAGTEERLLVRRALALLEPDHARVIELALLEELSHREVATRLGRSEGACRMLLQRARAALALALEQLTRGVD